MSAARPGLFSGLVHFAFNKYDFLFVCLKTCSVIHHFLDSELGLHVVA